MKTIKKIMFLAGLCCALTVSGCSSQKEEQISKPSIEGLKQLGEVHIVSREVGSGTRSTFAELVDFLKNDEGKPDLTASEAQIADNAVAVCYNRCFAEFCFSGRSGWRYQYHRIGRGFAYSSGR